MSALRALGWLTLAACKAAVVALSIDPLRDPRQPKFSGKAMRVRVMGYGLVLAVMPLVHRLRRGGDRYPLGTDLALTVPLLIDAGGNAAGVYEEAHLDDVVHFANAAIIMAAVGEAARPWLRDRPTAFAVIATLGTAGSAIWECWEYIAFRFGARGMNLTYTDTMDDLLESTCGSVVGGLITAARWRPR